MILIKGQKEEFALSIMLEDVITQLPNYDSYKWRILWVNGVSFKIDISELEKEVNDSQNGKGILGEELIIFSRQFEQMLELLLIGDKDENKLKRYKKEDDMKKECEFVIELVDGSYWEVTSKNDQFNVNLIENLGAEEATY